LPHSLFIQISKKYEFFSPIDLMSTFLGLIIISILVYIRSSSNKEKEFFSYYPRAYYFKLVFVLANATFYIVSYGGGGDSIGFWDGGVKLNHVFWESPTAYFRELVDFRETRDFWQYYSYFDGESGFPDNRIYEEESSFFVSKIVSIIGFFSFKGYLFMSVVFAFFTTNASMKLFETLRDFGLHSDRHLALAVFFIPSLSFWCGGISKDTLMWVSICYFLYNIHYITSKDKKQSIFNWVGLVICLYVMYRVRSFMLVATLLPLMYSYGARIGKRFGSKSFERTSLRLLFGALGIIGILVFFRTPIADQYIQEAAIIHKDMTTNQTYTGAKYDLGVTDYSPFGMVKAFPASVVAGFFRPFIWESLSISLIIDGIQSSILVYYLVLFFFNNRFSERVKRIRNEEILIFSFFFALILAFFAGYTSILFGILVRFKAPVLPFLVLVLTAHLQPEKRALEEDSEAQGSTGSA
jgi:hypothetical protein